MTDPATEVFSAIERLVARDPAGRNVAALVLPGELERAARTLLNASRVGIVSGFFVPAAGAGETDGPPGALAIGNALRELAIAAEFVTDRQNAPLLQTLGAAPLHLWHPGLPQSFAPSHLVAVERLGRAADGHYYNMRGEDIGAHTAPVDEWFLQAPARGIVTIGIGDGGNEIGMGRVHDRVAEHVLLGARIGCVVPTDHLIVCGVSNWGAYGLVAALARLSGKKLLPSAETARAEILRLVAAGAVDGATRRRETTVDGIALQPYLALLEELRALEPGG